MRIFARITTGEGATIPKGIKHTLKVVDGMDDSGFAYAVEPVTTRRGRNVKLLDKYN